MDDMARVGFVDRFLSATRGGVVSEADLRALQGAAKKLTGPLAQHAARLLDYVSFDRELDPQERREVAALLGQLGATPLQLTRLHTLPACNLQIQHLDLDVDLHREPARCQVKLQLGKGAPERAVLEANEQLLHVRSVHAGHREVEFKQDNGRLTFAGHGAKTITVEYDLDSRSKLDGTGLIARGNEKLTLTWPERVCDLFPGDTRPGLAVTASVTLHASRETVLQGTGKRVAGGPGWSTFELTTAAPPHAIGFYAAERGERLRLEDEQGPVYVSRRASKAIDQLRERHLEVAAATGRFMEKLFGPTPLGPMEAVIEVPAALGGMENARAILMERASSRQVYEGARTTAHEVIHMWWGNAVRPKSHADLWLSEGFTTYFTMRALAPGIGGVNYRTMLSRSVDGAVEDLRLRWKSDAKYPLRPDAEAITNTAIFDEVTYELGAWVLLAMEQQLGRARFDQMLAAWFDHSKKLAVSTDDFFAFAERRSGESFAAIRERWVDHLPPVAEFKRESNRLLEKLAPPGRYDR